MMFESVLVANRGEIAVRIIRTLRRLGIRSIAVYSDADRGSRHVGAADEAIRLGPTPAHESYLNVDRILTAARDTSATAIHPGYGFLSENAPFARECEAQGFVFIGPSPEAIELMGDKIRAKIAVSTVGVPVVPGIARPGLTDDDLVAAAADVGYPVLVKPSAGGGGKGMHLVEAPQELRRAIESARREAAASFGDDALFLERFVSKPRHIEVQILADSFGTTLHLGERECSLQRRHQKVIEESPSPLIDAATRERLGASAVEVAKIADYVGVGTVEFIVSADNPHEFFFMEMNTRLQVEHPVTEMVTGLDLVEQQLLVASGEHLAFGPDNVVLSGHAIEARVYSESPARDFLPTSGVVALVREASGEGVRIDSSIMEGLVVGTSYDPMLAKIIAWAPNRAGALVRLHAALGETVILGLGTNVGFLQKLLTHPSVLTGDIDTGLIKREVDNLVTSHTPASAYAAYALSRLDALAPPGALVDPWEVRDGWRIGGRNEPLTFRLVGEDGASESLTLRGTSDHANLRVGESETFEVSLTTSGEESSVSLDGASHPFWLVRTGDVTWVSHGGESWCLREEETAPRQTGRAVANGEIRSPMPGTVIKVLVERGEMVQSGQPLVVVEAMKMEHVLTASVAGSATPLVRTGDQVAVDDVVAQIEVRATPDSGES